MLLVFSGDLSMRTWLLKALLEQCELIVVHALAADFVLMGELRYLIFPKYS